MTKELLELNKRNHHGKINKKRLGLTLENIESGNKILDFGCARGEYVSTLRSLGYDVKGVDILDFTDEWNELGIQDFCSVSSGEVPNGINFDVVLLFEVLEHIPNPIDFLISLKPILNGKLILSVPNCDNPAFMVKSGLNYNHFTDSSHVNFFSEETLVAALTKAGYKIHVYKKFNPINTIVPLLYQLGLPLGIASVLGKSYRFLPRQNYFTQFVVATKC